MGEVFFEFTQLGAQMRVAAIDAASGTEIVILAPVNASRTHMETVALAKLQRRLAQAPGVGASRRDDGPGFLA